MATKLFCVILFTYSYIAALTIVEADKLSCKALGICCRPNEPAQRSCKLSDPLLKRECWCDAKCKHHGDCCSDFTSYCENGEPDDCELSQWTEWGECKLLPGASEHACSSGVQYRQRTVLKTGNKNGLRCSDNMNDKRTCHKDDCYSIDVVPVVDKAEWRRQHMHYKSAYFVISQDNQCGVPKQNKMACVLCDMGKRPELCESLIRTEKYVLRENLDCVNVFEQLTKAREQRPCMGSMVTFAI